MLSWIAYYEANRIDSNLCYFKNEKNEYKLSTFVLYYGNYKFQDVINEDCIINYDYTNSKNIIVKHPTSKKNHVCLYTNGCDVIDGYGMKWSCLTIKENCLQIKNTLNLYHINIEYTSNNETIWEQNLKNKIPNIYGIIPNEDEISIIESIPNRLIFLSGLQQENILKYYKNPEILRTFIKNIDLLLYRHLEK